MKHLPDIPNIQIEDILDLIPLRIFWKDLEGKYLGCNTSFAKNSGKNCPSELIGKTDYEMGWSEQADSYRKDDFEIISSGIPKINFVEPQTLPDGTRIYIKTSKFPLKNQKGEIYGVLGSFEDITDLKKEEELKFEIQNRSLQNQKLESLGMLAGGIAHDFNNYLLAILGNLELSLNDLEDDPEKARESIMEARKIILKAANLSKQMLAYSGKGKFTIYRFNLNELIKDISNLLKATISKTIQLNFHLSQEKLLIEGDPSQIQQVILNLINNASEAIGEHPGTIIITTGRRKCDHTYLERNNLFESLSEGNYCYLEVSDSGIGMSKDIQKHIFEPFFTTKENNRGLGLSAVLGIVKGHKGSMMVYSEERKGTTMKILLPAADSRSRPDVIETKKMTNFDRQKKAYSILVVDDEESIRKMVKKMLEKQGYNVILAVDGEDAIEKYMEHRNEIECVLLDLTMPKLDGITAFSRLKDISPNIKVILSSGYNQQEISRRYVSKGLAGFLQKPYEMQDLLDLIRKTCRCEK